MGTNANKHSKLYLAIAIILIIAFLLGFDIPSYFYHITKSHTDLTAYSEIQYIETAIKNYSNEYGGIYPIKMNKRYSEMSNSEEYDKLINTLTTPCYIKGYSKEYSFSRFLGPTTGKDPWGLRYDILIKEPEPGSDYLLEKIFIYSYGGNKIDDKGEKDDICSWKKPTPRKILHIKIFGNDIFSILIR